MSEPRQLASAWMNKFEGKGASEGASESHHPSQKSPKTNVKLLQRTGSGSGFERRPDQTVEESTGALPPFDDRSSTRGKKRRTKVARKKSSGSKRPKRASQKKRGRKTRRS